jgi:hypothetical protein
VAPRVGGTCGLDTWATPLRGDELRGCWRPVRDGYPGARAHLPVVDPLGPAFAVPGGIWAEPES